MNTLAKVIGGMMMAEGAAMVASPHGYLKLWDRESTPAWLRKQVEPWLKMPEAALRMVGASMVLVSGLLLAESRCEAA